MSIVVAASAHVVEVVRQVTDPTAIAPPGVGPKVDRILGIVKWASLTAVCCLWLASGVIVFAADHGHGGGLTPELKKSVTRGTLALVVVGSAAALVNFLVS